MRRSWLTFARLSPRERYLVTFTLACVIGYGVYSAISEIRTYVADTKRVLALRSTQLEDLSRVVRRYKTLNSRLEKAQKTFAQSQTTFKEVTDQLDRIVRQTIGSNTHDLKKGGSPSQVGFDYEKQAFTLNVRSLSLEQVIKLLYELEQGGSPLFLGKVDIIRSSADNSFAATLEIFSIQKKSS